MAFFYRIQINAIATLLCFASAFQFAAAQKVIFSDNFEEGNFRQAWKLQAGQPNGVVEVFPTNTLAGNYAVRLGKSSDDKFALNRLDLPVDLSGYGQVMLELMIYNNMDETHVQDGIFLSTDGGINFYQIYAFSFEEWPERKGGKLPPINLSALARKKGILLNAQTVIRFQQYGKDDFTGSADFADGYFIDDIMLSAVEIPYARLPLNIDFSSGITLPLLAGDPSLSDSTDVLSPSSLLEVSKYDSLHGNVLRMGSSLDKSPTTNAIDIYVNLAGQEYVKMKFDILDNHDETHPADGLFFSDNGGYSFKKVFAFQPDLWSDGVFGSFPPLDIDLLAKMHGLQLNDRFVIRIQQHDDDDFDGSRLSSDGFMIDNIHLYTAPPVYTELPIAEHFDQDIFPSYWQIGHAYYADLKTSISPNGNIQIISTEEGNRAVSLGNATDKCYSTNALDLYTKLAKHPDARLSFRYYDHFDETHEQDGIFFSNNGGKSFKKVFSFDNDNWVDMEMGEFRSLNIRQLAMEQGMELSDTFVIRFQQHDDDDFVGTRTISDGILLDDIIIDTPRPVYATLPLVDDFEGDTLASHWSFGNPLLTASLQDLKPGGFVGIRDSIGSTKSKGLALGRITDGKPTTNSVDLHLNLAREQDLLLHFWLYNNYDEPDAEDGLWLSKDGGRSFKKAWAFPETGGHAELFQIDLDSITYAAGLRYSEQFVIRFQQKDDRRFSGRGNLRGGIFLDDFLITHSLEAPVILWPPDSTQLTVCGEYFFRWSMIDKASQYDIQVFSYDNDKEVVVQDTSISLSEIKVTGLVEDSTYYCKIRSSTEHISSQWSPPVAFRTYATFKADLQITGRIDEESKLVLEASKLPSCEYIWYKNGELLSESQQHILKVDEPGSYSVFISNTSCGIMSPALEVNEKILGFKDISEDIRSTENVSLGMKE